MSEKLRTEIYLPLLTLALSLVAAIITFMPVKLRSKTDKEGF